MEIFYFFLKSLIVVLSIAAVILVIAIAASKAQQKHEMEVEPLHKKFQDVSYFLKSFLLSKAELKEEKKALKEQEKKEKEETPDRKIFVLNFDGDINASETEHLREEITAVLQVATSKDEVVVRLESPGGVVHGYGLAASQLMRIRDRGIKLTVCVDKVAASGGYMMACVANKIVAAPFSILGSIGVVAQLPNVHRLLKKHDIDFREYTAGEFKRTVGVFSEITPEKEAHFQTRLHDTHSLFKSFVLKFRPHLDIQKIATGDYWFGEEALKLGLVDVLMTSDDYLLSFGKQTPIYELKYHVKESLQEKISNALGKASEKVFVKIFTELEKRHFL
jgi:serine protease SohB